MWQQRGYELRLQESCCSFCSMCIWLGRRGLEVTCGLTPSDSTASGREDWCPQSPVGGRGEIEERLWIHATFCRLWSYVLLPAASKQASSSALCYLPGWRDRLSTHNGTEKQKLQRIAWDWQDQTIKLCCVVISELGISFPCECVPWNEDTQLCRHVWP